MNDVKLVDQHYKVVSHEFDVFQKFRVFKPHVDQYSKVLSHDFDVFRKFQICSNHL